MIGFRYLAPAETEAANAISYYEEEAGLGKEFLDDLESRIDVLRRFPKIGTPIGPRARRSVLARFPYSIVYFVYKNEIVIAAVAHQSRKPKYWSSRLT